MGATSSKNQSADDEKTQLQEKLRRMTGTLGKRDFDTLDALYGLAYRLNSRGEYDEAAELLRKAIAVLAPRLGEDHSRTTHTNACLALVLTTAAKHEEAERVLRQILKSEERALGKEHEATLEWTERLAWCLFNQGKYDEIKELYPLPPEQTEAGVIVVDMYNDTSRMDEMERVYRGSADLKTRMLGEEHPAALAAVSNLADWLRGHHQRDVAEQLYRRVVAARTKALGSDDPETLDSMASLAGNLSDQEKYSDAEGVFRELLALQEKKYGSKHLKVVETTSALATVCKELGRLDDAGDMLRKLVSLQLKIRGEEHLKTLDCMNDLALLISDQGQLAEAENILRRVTELRGKKLGRDNPKTLMSLSYVAIMLEKQGKGAEVAAALDSGAEDGVFSYQPLTSARSTRIIVVHPSRYEDAALVCELSEKELDEKNPPSYAAISYTWGSQGADRRIFCHGRKFPVTENVECILRRFRRPDKMSYLWIDAICIDQTSDKEKSQQIPLMEDIYRLAEVVVVWLGPSTGLTAKAFEYLQGQGQKDHLSAHEAADPGAVTRDILERPWFTRMWTIQEVALSSPGAVVVCSGKHMMRWETLARSVGNNSLVPAPARSAFQIFHRLGTLFQAARVDSRRPGAVVSPQMLLRSFTPLAEVLKIFVEIRGRLSTDGRDKVFALYGILNAMGATASFPDPDYSKSAEQVFCETAEAIIKHDGKPHVLYHVLSRARMSNLPTWVPDWSDVDAIDNSPPYEFHSASRNSRVDWRLSSASGNGATLCIAGKVIDRVSSRARSLSENGLAVPDDDLGVFRDWIRHCRRVANSNGAPGSAETALYQNLVQIPPTDDGLCIPLSHSYRDQTSWEAFEGWLKVVIGPDVSDGPQPIAPGTPAFSGSAGTFYDTIRGLLQGKALFLTDKKSIGIGWNTVQEGDVVALLSGLEVPIILRPAKDGYRVVCWAYIGGVMLGEAWPAAEDLEAITLV